MVADCPFNSAPVAKQRPQSTQITQSAQPKPSSQLHLVGDADSIAVDIGPTASAAAAAAAAYSIESQGPLSFQNPLFAAHEAPISPPPAHVLHEHVVHGEATAAAPAGGGADLESTYNNQDDEEEGDDEEWEQSIEDCKVDSDVSIDEMVARLSKQASAACRPAIPHPAQRMSKRLLEQFVGAGQNIAGIIYLSNLASAASEQPDKEELVFRRDIARLNDTIDTLLSSAELGARGKHTTRLLCLHNKNALVSRRRALGCPSWKQRVAGHDAKSTDRSVVEHPFNHDVSGALDCAQSQLMAQFSSLIVAVNDHARPHAQDVINMWITTWQHMFPQQQGRWLPNNV